MKIFQQYNVPHVGKFLYMYYQTLPLLGVVAQCFTAATMYGVWRSGIMVYFPWLTMPVFFGLLILCGMFGMFVVFKYFNLSFYEAQNSQQFPDNSPLMQGIRKAVREEVRKELIEAFKRERNE